METYVALHFYRMILIITNQSKVRELHFFTIPPYLSLSFHCTRNTEKRHKENYTFTYLFFILYIEFHIVGMQIKLLPKLLAPHFKEYAVE